MCICIYAYVYRHIQIQVYGTLKVMSENLRRLALKYELITDATKVGVMMNVIMNMKR